MLTDDEIRAIHDGRIDESYHHGHMQEICTRLLSAEARVKVLEGLVTELTMDLENEIDARYGQDIHPAMKRRYENDIEVCRRARTALQDLT
jgi:hypothetical protein